MFSGSLIPTGSRWKGVRDWVIGVIPCACVNFCQAPWLSLSFTSLFQSTKRNCRAKREAESRRKTCLTLTSLFRGRGTRDPQEPHALLVFHMVYTVGKKGALERRSHLLYTEDHSFTLLERQSPCYSLGPLSFHAVTAWLLSFLYVMLSSLPCLAFTVQPSAPSSYKASHLSFITSVQIAK